MNNFKFALSIFFLVLGLTCAILTFTDAAYTYTSTPHFKYRGGSVREYKDGIAIGLGIISGFSFLSSVLLLNSINKIKE